ncbi:MAG: NHL repeat-containing protein [Acidobacteria bacterium]|nr:NHL repeat-containing protein [Acidobacteriota bacterium]
MKIPTHSPPVSRRVFLNQNLKGAVALALSGLVLLSPKRGIGAALPQRFLDIPAPQFPAWTPDGNILVTFISKNGNYGLLQKKAEAEESGTLLSVGTAIGQFNWPQGIAVNGSIAYIVDSNNGRIQRFDLGARAFMKPFGALGKKSGLFLRPAGICIFRDEIFIADTRNHRIQVFSIEGVIKRVFGELGDANDQFRLPTSCAVSPAGEVFVVDSKHALVKVFNLEGRFVRKFGGLSSSRREPGLLNLPNGIALDSKGDAVYVADSGNSRIQVFNKNGKFLGFIEAPEMMFKTPHGLAISGAGEMAVSDTEADKVWLTTV